MRQTNISIDACILRNDNLYFVDYIRQQSTKLMVQHNKVDPVLEQKYIRESFKGDGEI
jgi:hypothetical protein